MQRVREVEGRDGNVLMRSSSVMKKMEVGV